ncbi:MAG: response regulator [Thermodesulfovibrionales bacterium]|nr:response regulator [Thermodesulfovibrionales bacterium]
MSKGKILVIDDSPIVRKMAEVALEEEGYEVYTAEDGEEGLKITEEVKPSIILVDFIMPKMSGYQFCQAIKENESLKDIPIILITGKGEDVGRKFSEKFQVYDYFIKPFKSADLVEKVNQIMNSQKMLVEEPQQIETAKAIEPEPITFTFEEQPVPASFEEEETVPLQDFTQPEPITFTFEEQSVPTSFEEEKSFSHSFAETEIQILTSLNQPSPVIEQTLSKTSSDVEGKITMDNYISEIEKIVEKSMKKFFYEDYQPNLQKNITDILKKSGVIKTSNIVLSGSVAQFPVKNILLLSEKLKLSGKLSILSDQINSDIYLKEGNIIGTSFNTENIQTLDNIYNHIASLLELSEGNFTIENIPLEEEPKSLSLNLSITEALLETSRRVNESLYLNIIKDNLIPIKKFSDKFIKDFNLTKSELLTLACINGERTINDINDLTGIEKNLSHRIFFTLYNLDFVNFC